MARHLWAFCVALATASQPQNATRQLDDFDDGRSAPHRTDVIRYWRESRKFGVVDPLTGTTSECDLTGDATKMIAARFEAETGRPKPRGYVACRGALSEAFMDGALATHLPWSGLQAA